MQFNVKFFSCSYALTTAYRSQGVDATVKGGS